MHTIFLKISTFLAAVTVALGAFAAHTLKGTISNEALAIFETGVRYQFYHVFALLATAIIYKDFPTAVTIWAGKLFIIGIILFSGSLYFLTWIKGAVIPGWNFIGIITPFGGLSFIGGWLCLFASVVKK
ncbi:MAG: DUF423 domain-containing protein [Bacteroidetes bacterium]|nr:DUF423 domain-containing protein [Bacteroidota bacterium]